MYLDPQVDHPLATGRTSGAWHETPHDQGGQRIGEPKSAQTAAAGRDGVRPDRGRRDSGCASRVEDSALARARDACDALHTLVMASDYPCVMARSVFNRDAFRLGTYGPLAHAGNASALCRDLYSFCTEFPQPVQGVVSFIAWFDGAAPANELDFEVALWDQLQQLHDIDKQQYGWSRAVASAANDPAFSFSVRGRAFFLIGMHPAASRLARRTPQPAIVFNLHEQFVELRSSGKFATVRDKFQARDALLQGDINPMAADFGERSEVAQYSGRAVGTDWVCPFAAG